MNANRPLVIAAVLWAAPRARMIEQIVELAIELS
jgi:hypothetical protein